MDRGTVRPEDDGLFPVRSKWFELGFYAFLLVWTLYILFEAARWDEFEDYFFVYILAPIVLALLSYRSLRALFPERMAFVEEIAGGDGAGPPGDAEEVSTRAQEDRGRESKAEEEKYAIYMLAWTAALPVGMFLFGMAWVLPIYIFAFTWFFTGNVRRSLLVTVVAVGAIYVIFIEILNVLLWTGYLGLPNPIEYVP